MFDFLLDETTNDLVISNKDLVFTSTTQESLRQRLSIRLLMYKGEWFLNESYGVPYTQEIIGVTRSKKIVDNILLANAQLELSASDTISNFESTYGIDSRNYSLSFDVSTVAGNVSVAINSDPATDFIYPEPTVFNPYADCSDLITIANDLYEYINFELPETGSSTWINQWG